MSFIGKFFSTIWVGLDAIRRGLGNLLILIILGLILAAVFSRQDIEIESGSALVLDVRGPLVQEKSLVPNFLGFLTNPMSQNQQTSVRDIVESLKAAKNDERIAGVVLDLNQMGGAGPHSLEQVGEALLDFKQSGKPITTVANDLNQIQYRLAVYSDKIYLNPMGSVLIDGFGTYQLFYKDAIDSLKISFNIFRVGTYKSAVEPFLLNKMSDEAKANAEEWLGDIWQGYKRALETQRNLDDGSIQNYADQYAALLKPLNGNAAALALKQGLIDEVAGATDQKTALIDIYGSDGDGSFKQVSFNTYRSTLNEPANLPTDQKIGVIVADGAIVLGNDATNVGSSRVIEQIQQAQQDDSIKALVLRINSPGGSAFASDLIHQALAEFKQYNKPLIASMADTAASGGYYIAANADQIWASPATITGSIGVFGLLPTFEKTLETVGINSDGIGTTQLSGPIPTGALTPAMSAYIQNNVEFIYDRFLSIVSEGRKMDKQAVDAIAQGRVWSGQRAKTLGLVDNLGGLNDALTAAAKAANLGDDYEVEYITRPLSTQEQIIRQFTHLFSPLAAQFSLMPFSTQQDFTSSPMQSALIRPLIEPGIRQMFQSMSDPKAAYTYCFGCKLHH